MDLSWWPGLTVLIVLTCLQLCHVTARVIAHAVDGEHADVVGEATHEVSEDAGLQVCLAVRFIFFHAEGLNSVGIGPSAGLPLHAGRVGGAVHYRRDIFGRTRHWKRSWRKEKISPPILILIGFTSSMELLDCV